MIQGSVCLKKNVQRAGGDRKKLETIDVGYTHRAEYKQVVQ